MYSIKSSPSRRNILLNFFACSRARSVPSQSRLSHWYSPSDIFSLTPRCRDGPPSTPSSMLSLRRHSPYLSVSPLVLSSVSPLSFSGRCLRSLVKPHNPTNQRHCEERQRPDESPNQALTHRMVAVAHPCQAPILAE